MKSETAKALHEVGKAIAKMHGFEGEIIMTINCRAEEVPDYVYELTDDDMEEMMNEIPNYFAEIESEFSRIRGKWSPLSPMDWQLADSWEKKGIPLHVVLTAMSEVFRKFESSKNPRKINGLSYFTQEVESKFASWSETQIGKSDESEEVEDVRFGDEIIGRLETIKWQLIDATDKCPNYLEVILGNISIWINDLLDEDDIETIEIELQKQKIQLDKTILESLPNDEFTELFNKTRQLVNNSGYESVVAQVAMQNKLICKEFYKKYNLPELTLYEL